MMDQWGTTWVTVQVDYPAALCVSSRGSCSVSQQHLHTSEYSENMTQTTHYTCNQNIPTHISMHGYIQYTASVTHPRYCRKNPYTNISAGRGARGARVPPIFFGGCRGPPIPYSLNQKPLSISSSSRTVAATPRVLNKRRSQIVAGVCARNTWVAHAHAKTRHEINNKLKTTK